MLKKLFSHTLIYGFAPQIVSLGSFFALPVITPFLTKTDYGISGVLTAVVSSVSVFSTLGLAIVLSNSYAQSPTQYKWLWRQLYGFLNLWNIVYSVLLAILIFFFIPDIAANNKWTIIVLNVLPSLLFGPASTIAGCYYQMAEKPMAIASRSVVIGLLTIGLNIFFIAHLKMGYMGWFWASGISQMLYQISYFIPLNFQLGLGPIYNFKWKTVKQKVALCLPTIPHFYSSYLLNTFDRVIMKFLKVDIGDIGRYNAAQYPGSLFSSATFAANQAVSPILIKAYREKDKKLELKVNFIILIVFLVLTTLAALFLKEVIPFVIKSPGMQGIYHLSIIIVMAYNYRPMYVAANNKLFYIEKTKALLKVTTIASLISVVLNLITIHFFGYQAAVIVLFISLMYMGYSGFFIKEFRQADNPNYHPVFWLLLTIGLTIFVYWAADLPFFYKLFIALLVVLSGGGSLLYIKRNLS